MNEAEDMPALDRMKLNTCIPQGFTPVSDALLSSMQSVHSTELLPEGKLNKNSKTLEPSSLEEIEAVKSASHWYFFVANGAVDMYESNVPLLEKSPCYRDARTYAVHHIQKALNKKDTVNLCFDGDPSTAPVQELIRGIVYNLQIPHEGKLNIVSLQKLSSGYVPRYFEIYIKKPPTRRLFTTNSEKAPTKPTFYSLTYGTAEETVDVVVDAKQLSDFGGTKISEEGGITLVGATAAWEKFLKNPKIPIKPTCNIQFILTWDEILAAKQAKKFAGSICEKTLNAVAEGQFLKITPNANPTVAQFNGSTGIYRERSINEYGNTQKARNAS